MATDRIIEVNRDSPPDNEYRAKYFPKPQKGYPDGLTRITDFRRDDTTLAVSFLKLRPGEKYGFKAERETAFVLMEGSVAVTLDKETKTLTRRNPVADDPSCIHLPVNAALDLIAGDAGAVFTFYEAENVKPFPAKIYLPDDTVSVYFDEKAQPIPAPTGTPTDRRVRIVFDNSNTDERVHTHPNVTLTVGEVLSLPACWSSWRPHHHQEPKDEIPRGYIEESYFYYTKSFGLSQMGGGQWQEVWHQDLVLHRGNNHSQVSSPDGAVCYIWVIYTPPGRKWIRRLDPAYQPPKDKE